MISVPESPPSQRNPKKQLAMTFDALPPALSFPVFDLVPLIEIIGEAPETALIQNLAAGRCSYPPHQYCCVSPSRVIYPSGRGGRVSR
jgi:hypothetical protein